MPLVDRDRPFRSLAHPPVCGCEATVRRSICQPERLSRRQVPLAAWLYHPWEQRERASRDVLVPDHAALREEIRISIGITFANEHLSSAFRQDDTPSEHLTTLTRGSTGWWTTSDA